MNNDDQLRRLAQALGTSSPLSHAQAQAVIPALIAAEQADEQVDDDPRFVPLLEHLASCESCLSLYETASEEAEHMADYATTLPPVAASAPRFFEPVRVADNAVVRVLKGVHRQIGMALSVPQVAPVSAGEGILVLFADEVAEAGAGVQVDVRLEPSVPQVQVQLRDPAADTWTARLQVDNRSYEATLDQNGHATMAGFSMAELWHAKHVTLVLTTAE